MNTEYRYQLDSPRVTGRRQQKTTCPQCGRKHCFVRYVDTHNNCQYIASDFGRCDHEQSCGYHYRPSEFFQDHPWLKDAEQQRPSGITHRPMPRPQPVFQPLAPELVWMSHSPQSTFWQWLSTTCRDRLSLTDADLQRVYNDYQIGATRRSDIIFWQIDEDQRVHTGHIMQYGPDGHRLSYNGWVHQQLMREGRLPGDYALVQCLFGQHLLSRYPDRQVCIVESEKTAIVCAARHPSQVWLATGGSGGLSAEKLSPLRGRRLTFFPDSGCYQKWLERLQQAEGLSYSVSEQLEAYQPNTDLADLLLGEALLKS